MALQSRTIIDQALMGFSTACCQCSFPLLRSSRMPQPWHSLYPWRSWEDTHLSTSWERCCVNLDEFFEIPLFSYLKKYSHKLNWEKYSNVSELPTFCPASYSILGSSSRNGSLDRRVGTHGYRQVCLSPASAVSRVTNIRSKMCK